MTDTARPPPAPAEPAAGGLVLQTGLLGPLTVPDGLGDPGELEDLSRRAALYATRARGDGTRRTYRGAWRHFAAWCDSLGRAPLPADPDTLAMYIVRRADDGLAVSSLRVALAAIKTAHLLAGLSLDLRHPRLAMVFEGITRSKGVRPRRQATPAVPGALRLLPPARPPADTPIGACDRAMLLLGFGAARRRSELVGLAIGDVAPVPGRGLMLTVRRSKTDQQGRGQPVAVWANPAEPSFCPAAALNAWLVHRRRGPDLAGAASDSERPLFCRLTKSGRLTGESLSDKAVARLVKQAAEDAGLDPALYSGHSLRAGLVTAAADAGAGLAELNRLPAAGRSLAQQRHRTAVRRRGRDRRRAGGSEMPIRTELRPLYPADRRS